MDRKEAKNFLPILQAFAEGKEIQYKDNGSWVDFDKGEGLAILQALSYPSNYRIKPEPKYRSFKDAEECWSEMLKHQPVGWLKDKSSDDYYVLLTYIDGNNIGLNGNNGWDFVEVMKGYTFADGTPFGIKEESEG